jgi:hypothetical protein
MECNFEGSSYPVCDRLRNIFHSAATFKKTFFSYAKKACLARLTMPALRTANEVLFRRISWTEKFRSSSQLSLSAWALTKPRSAASCTGALPKMLLPIIKYVFSELFCLTSENPRNFFIIKFRERLQY